MERDVFNKDMMQGYTIAEQMVSESGIYKQTLGQPLAAGTAFFFTFPAFTGRTFAFGECSTTCWLLDIRGNL